VRAAARRVTMRGMREPHRHRASTRDIAGHPLSQRDGWRREFGRRVGNLSGIAR
jgi:hypothetical protein